MTLPERYNPKEAEKRWQEQWFKDGVYAWEENGGNNYVIDTPPPTVSGLLHMGHIFSYTQADFVARFQRMTGKNVFYPMGFDDNGLPTERLVEKVEKKRAVDMSREDFIKLCEKVVVEAEDEFRILFKSIALSVDWKQEYQTISNESRKISQMSFLDLYKKERAYKQQQPMLWDPVDQTAIAQAEIEDKELPSFANDIPFGIVDENTDPSTIKWNDIQKVTIMTTRPELLAACVALMCHPDDAVKYKGKKAVTPLFGVVVPIIADEKVDKEKGTGLVMCCTFGDETDIMWWKKHNLQMRIVLNKFGKIDLSGDWLQPQKERAYCSTLDHKLKELNNLKVSNADPKYPGARQKTIELLKEFGCLINQKPITHAVKCAERSGAPVEYLPTSQWFIKILDQKEQLKEKARQCIWRPEYMRIRIEQWIDGLNWDWCISRQRYFGVPFPVWYSKRAGEEGKILVADKDQLPVNPLVDLPKGYKKDEVTPDMDVMDTWATSSVSPQLSSKAINKDFAVDIARHKQLFPADLRPQAHEIIRTWAFYTIVKAHLHEDTIPWKNLMISGWCLAADKTKMSKSKGNVITPTSLIEEKGSDAVRYWASTSRLGSDTAFSEDVLKIGNKLVNKLWNASKFALIHLEKVKGAPQLSAVTEPLDRWIITRLSRAIEKATAEFVEYEYCAAREHIEDFFWKDFCDNYLEMIKVRAYGEGPAAASAHHATALCLEAVLRLFAPFVPHITEELYQNLFPAKHSIHSRNTWPKATAYFIDEKAEASGTAAVEVLDAVRAIKAEKKVSIKWPLEFVVMSSSLQAKIAPVLEDVKAVTNAKEVRFASSEAIISAYELSEKSDAA
jgi:valyl-tRNA synthetase